VSGDEDCFGALLSDYVEKHSSGKMTVPPETKGTLLASRNSHQIILTNPFAEVSITIVFQGGSVGIGDYTWLLGYDRKKSDEFWSEYFDVNCKVRFRKLRSGHPDIPRYKRWVETIFDETEYQFSDRLRLQRARDYRDLRGKG